MQTSLATLRHDMKADRVGLFPTGCARRYAFDRGETGPKGSREHDKQGTSRPGRDEDDNDAGPLEGRRGGGGSPDSDRRHT